MRSVDGGHVACLHGRPPALRINAPPPRSTGLRRESRGSPRLRPRGRQPPNPQACFQGPPTPQALSSKTAPGPGFAETEHESDTRPSCAAGPSRDQSRHLSCGRDRGTPLLTPEWSGAREGSMQAHRPLWASQLPPAPPPTHDPRGLSPADRAPATMEGAQRLPAKPVLGPGQTSAQAVRRGWGMGSTSRGVGTEWLCGAPRAPCLLLSTARHVSTHIQAHGRSDRNRTPPTLGTGGRTSHPGLCMHTRVDIWVCAQARVCEPSPSGTSPHTPPDPPAPSTACTWSHATGTPNHTHHKHPHAPGRAHCAHPLPGVHANKPVHVHVLHTRAPSLLPEPWTRAGCMCWRLRWVDLHLPRGHRLGPW